jgi:2-methylcitrate dehydratase PrpD
MMQGEKMALSEQIVLAACNIRYQDLPDFTIERAKLFLLDTIGVAFAGRHAEGVDGVLEMVRELAGTPQAKVFGVNLKVPAPLAAMTNSLMAHARDFDDLYEPGGAHVNITVVPAAIAAAQKKGGVSGENFLISLIAGVDLVCRLGVAMPVYRGWHVSATFGVFGAALASGLILDLTPQQLANALGLAYSRCAGTRQGRLEGTLAKRLQPALACQSGVMAALLGQKGITGPKEWLEGTWGLVKVYGDDHSDPSDLAVEKLKNNLGKEFYGDGLSFKLYPCCKVTHTSIEAALSLKKEHNLRVEEIERVSVNVSPGAYNTVGQPFEIRTDSQVDAQFSIPYTVALALTDGQVSLSGFEPNRILDPRIKDFAKKVYVKADPEMRDISANMVNLATKMVIHTPRGSFLKELSICKGHPSNPPQTGEVIEKFKECVRYGRSLSEDQIESTVQLLFDIENLTDVDLLFDNL